MKIATWNIISIKVRLPAVMQYLEETSPDVLALQETKAIDENFPKEEIEKLGYSCIFSGQKTYNGVALISKTKPAEISKATSGAINAVKRLTTIKLRSRGY